MQSRSDLFSRLGPWYSQRDSEFELTSIDSTQSFTFKNNKDEYIAVASKNITKDRIRFSFSFQAEDGSNSGAKYGITTIDQDSPFRMLKNGLMLKSEKGRIKIFFPDKRQQFPEHISCCPKELLDLSIVEFMTKKTIPPLCSDIYPEDQKIKTFEIGCVSADHHKIYKYFIASGLFETLDLNPKSENVEGRVVIEGECIYETPKEITDFKLISLDQEDLQAIYFTSGEIQIGKFVNNTFYPGKTIKGLPVSDRGELFFSETHKLLVNYSENSSTILFWDFSNLRKLNYVDPISVEIPPLKGLKLSPDGRYLFGIKADSDNTMCLIDIKNNKKVYETKLPNQSLAQDLLITEKNNLYSVNQGMLINHGLVSHLLQEQRLSPIDPKLLSKGVIPHSIFRANNQPHSSSDLHNAPRGNLI